jgi:hypothetical protein
MDVPSQDDTSACTSACIFTKKGYLEVLNLICKTAADKAIACNCSCDDLVKIERPSVSIMAFGYLAQSMVVVLVGINMGLRLTTDFFPDSKMHQYFDMTLTLTLSTLPLRCLSILYIYIYIT